MGGGRDTRTAFEQQIKWSGGGDFLIIRSDDDPTYNPWVYGSIGGVHSCATIVLQLEEGVNDPFVLQKVAEAEAIFFAGGNQWVYYALYRNSKMNDLILKARSTIPLGGTSAGCMILSSWSYIAKYEGVESSDALQNPYRVAVTFGAGFVNVSYMVPALLDTHFVIRDRFGRLLTFVSRLAKDNNQLPFYGIGIDQKTALAVDHTTGEAKMFQEGPGGTAYIIKIGKMPTECDDWTPLTTPQYEVQLLEADHNDTYSFATWSGGRSVNRYTVGANNGTLTTTNPYRPPS